MAISLSQAAYDVIVRQHGQALYDVSEATRQRDSHENDRLEAQDRLEGFALLLTQVEVKTS